MVDCRIQHALRRSLLLLITVVLLFAIARSLGQIQQQPGRGYIALYACTITAELLWVITIAATIILLERLPKVCTCFGIVCDAVSVVLSITELGVMTEEPSPQLMEGNIADDDILFKLRWGAAYMGMGFLYVYYAYDHLRPLALHPAPPAGNQVVGGGQAQHGGELVQITLGG